MNELIWLGLRLSICETHVYRQLTDTCFDAFPMRFESAFKVLVNTSAHYTVWQAKNFSFKRSVWCSTTVYLYKTKIHPIPYTKNASSKSPIFMRVWSNLFLTTKSPCCSARNSSALWTEPLFHSIFDILPKNFCTFVDNLTESAELDFLGLLSAAGLN